MLDVVLKVDKKFEGPFLDYVFNALGSRSLIRGFRGISVRPITAGSFLYVVVT